MNYRSFLKALCSVLMLCLSFVACEPEPPVTGGGNTGGGNTGNKVTYSESGLYMGITGFNNDLYHYMNDGRYFSLLTESSSPRFKGFVNGLKIDISTVLYYAVDASVSNMEQATFPDDMTKVALITFTDGLDEGSFAYDSKYADVRAVSQHLKSARVDGKSIEAYAIGLKGNDVVDEAKFKADLTALSSSAENAMEVKDMSEVDAKFQELAASLYNESQVQSITLTVPVKPSGVKTRFTFEGNLANESQSNCYIEGVWDNNGSLTNVTYVGLKCSSGSTVSSSTVADNKTLRTFTFTDIAKADGSEVVTGKVQVWNMNVGSTVWTPNSEFDPSKNSQTIVEQKSALIMLVLDCSSSLGEEGLQQIKQTVNNFIEIMKQKEVDSSDPSIPDVPGTTAGHDWVDLGLSVKWATTNVGASKPEGYGTFYTYEEAQGRLWTSPWRTPSRTELEELKDKCIWEWTTQNGVNGHKVTGPNGNSIFLPAAGDRLCSGGVYGVGTYGYYWSSTPYDSGYARCLYFLSSEVFMNYSLRCYGLSVRLVLN